MSVDLSHREASFKGTKDTFEYLIFEWAIARGGAGTAR